MRLFFAVAALTVAGYASALFTGNWTVPKEITAGNQFQVTFERANSLTNNAQYGILFGLDGHNLTSSNGQGNAIGQYFQWVDLAAKGEQSKISPLTLDVTVPKGTQEFAYDHKANLSAVVWGAIGASGGVHSQLFHQTVQYKGPNSS